MIFNECFLSFQSAGKPDALHTLRVLRASHNLRDSVLECGGLRRF
jgi:hypothetical protein